MHEHLTRFGQDAASCRQGLHRGITPCEGQRLRELSRTPLLLPSLLLATNGGLGCTYWRGFAPECRI